MGRHVDLLFLLSLVLCCGACSPRGDLQPSRSGPYAVVLGIAQDGGIPQAGTKDPPAWRDACQRRRVVCLAVLDPRSQERWMFEATPDFREQLHLLDEIAPDPDAPGLDGIFLTHAHMGHYTGLMFLGFESLGSTEVPVYAMPRMASYLRTNGPWEQLVRYRNIELRELEDGVAVRLNPRISVTPFLVPHRQEYSEVVGFRLEGPRRSLLFIPDINSWEEWDTWGTRIEDVLAQVDVAYLDGSFFADGEVPGRDMSTFPHPLIADSLRRFAPLPHDEKTKIRFIHLNHTNPALLPHSEARRQVEEAGLRIATELEQIDL